MKFWDYLLQGIDSFNISNTAPTLSTKSNINPNFYNNYVKKPEKTVAILQPQNFNEVLKFVNFISGNRSAVVDFNALNNTELVRAIDFISGAVCALKGEMQEVSKGIYLYTPSCTKLMTNKRKNKNEK